MSAQQNNPPFGTINANGTVTFYFPDATYTLLSYSYNTRQKTLIGNYHFDNTKRYQKEPCENSFSLNLFKNIGEVAKVKFNLMSSSSAMHS